MACYAFASMASEWELEQGMRGLAWDLWTDAISISYPALTMSHYCQLSPIYIHICCADGETCNILIQMEHQITKSNW